MAARTKAATAQVATPAQAVSATDMMAAFAAFMAQQDSSQTAAFMRGLGSALETVDAKAAPAAPAAAPKAKAQAAKADPAQAVEAAIKAAGGTVTRVGKSGTTPKGMPKAWVDVSFGGIRIQGNAWVKAPSK